MKDGEKNLPREIERKFLIKLPSEEEIAALPELSASEIVQTYLYIKEDGVRRRVRKRGSESGFKFYYTEKKDVAFGERIEIEREVTETEYGELLKEADPERRTIEKTRCCFRHEGQLFELDIYVRGEELLGGDYATLEIELDDINEEVKIPEYIEVVRDVTGDKRYNNSALAKKI
jgi:CYTH domain-containing protein